jgi:hypothetical protein
MVPTAIFHLLTSLATEAKLSPMVGSKVTSRGADVVGVGYEAKTTASCTNLQKSPDKELLICSQVLKYGYEQNLIEPCQTST